MARRREGSEMRTRQPTHDVKNTAKIDVSEVAGVLPSLELGCVFLLERATPTHSGSELPHSAR